MLSRHIFGAGCHYRASQPHTLALIRRRFPTRVVTAAPAREFVPQPLLAPQPTTLASTQPPRQKQERHKKRRWHWWLLGGAGVLYTVYSGVKDIGDDFLEQFVARLEATNGAVASLDSGSGTDEQRERAFDARAERQVDSSRGYRGGSRSSITCCASTVTLPGGQAVDVCTFRRADLPATGGVADERVIVLNAGSIAAARPLALELARQADCSVVAYTHAGLRKAPTVTEGPPFTHSASGSSRPPFISAMFAMQNLLVYPLAAFSLTRDDAPLFSDRALPPVPLSADPTSDAESDELVSVLRHVGAERAVLVSSGFNWMATMKAALRNESHVAGLVLVDPYLPDHVSRVFEGDCPYDGPFVGARDDQVHLDMAAVSRGPPIAHASVAAASDVPVHDLRELPFLESARLSHRLDMLSRLRVRPLYVRPCGSLALGLPLHTTVPLGVIRAISVINPLINKKEEDDDEDESDEAAPDLLRLFAFVASESLPAVAGLLSLPVPLFASDFVTAAYLRSQTVGGVGPYGAVAPHAFIRQTVRTSKSDEDEGNGKPQPAEFSDSFVGWLPPRQDSEDKWARWSLTPALAAASSPVLDIESLLAASDKLFMKPRRDGNGSATDGGTDAVEVTSERSSYLLAAVFANFAKDFLTAVGRQYSADISTLIATLDRNERIVNDQNPEDFKESRLGVAVAENRDGWNRLRAQIFSGVLGPDACREYCLQQIESLKLENYMYEQLLSIQTDVNGSSTFRTLPGRAALSNSALALNSLAASGVKFDDFQASSGESHALLVFGKYLSARSAASNVLSCDPLCYNNLDLDQRTAALLAGSASQRRGWMSLWGGLAVNGSSTHVNLLEMPVFASRNGWWSPSSDMRAATRACDDTPAVSSDDHEPFTLPAAPDFRLSVDSMSSLLRGLSYRSRTLERYRADIEPHHWNVPLTALESYEAAINDHASLTPVGFGRARQPAVLSGESLEQCRHPTPLPSVSGPSMKDAPELSLQAHPFLFNRLPATLPASPARIADLYGATAAGGLVQAGERHLWLGLMAWVRANFAQPPHSDEGAPRPSDRSKVQFARNAVSFPVRVFITSLSEGRIHDPAYATPALLWNITAELGTGSRRPRITKNFAGFSLPAYPPSAALVQGRALLHNWQQHLLAAWKDALPAGCVIAIGAESAADVAASLNVTAALLQRNLSLEHVLAGVDLSGPVVNTHVRVSAAGTELPVGLVPAASPHSDDPLTALSDALAAGPPQPYRPPVSTVAREVVSLLRSNP
jgi:hypothetical protein